MKKNYCNIFRNKNTENLKLICITPRSGNNLLRTIFSSYYEINFNRGNGVPKYDSFNDKWRFNIELDNFVELYSSTFIDNSFFNPHGFAFTQFPINKINLVDLATAKPIIILRNPIDTIVSWYFHEINAIKKNKDEKINFDLLEKKIKSINYAFSFWENYIIDKKNKKDYLLIKYEDLLESTEKSIISIFNFLNIDIDLEIMKKSISLNSKESHKIYIGKNLNSSIRISKVENESLVGDILKVIKKNVIKTSLYK